MNPEELEAKFTVVEAPPGTKPFVPEEVKRIAVELVPLPPEVPEIVWPAYEPSRFKWVKIPEAKPVKKSLILDIETTGDKPWESRIFAISFMDPARPEVEPVCMINEKEDELVKDFLEWYEGEGYDDIIGYNVSFDFRFIFAACMRYRLAAKSFFTSTLSDLMQVMKQVQVKFVFGYNKPGKLEEWAMYLLGKKKTLNYKQLLRAWRERELGLIGEYGKNDVRLTYELWALTQLAFGEVVIASETTPVAETNPPETSAAKGYCKTCGQEKKLALGETAWTCEVCHTDNRI